MKKRSSRNPEKCSFSSTKEDRHYTEMIQHLAKPASLGVGGSGGRRERTESHQDSLLWPGKTENLGTGIPNSCASFCQKTAHDSTYKFSGKFNSQGGEANCLAKKHSLWPGIRYIQPAQHCQTRQQQERGTLPDFPRWKRSLLHQSLKSTRLQNHCGQSPHITPKLDQQMIIWKEISFASE